MEVKLGQEIHDTIRFISSTLPDNIEVKLICSTDNDRISIDQTQLQRVIINLITNAVHAMAEK